MVDGTVNDEGLWHYQATYRIVTRFLGKVTAGHISTEISPNVLPLPRTTGQCEHI